MNTLIIGCGGVGGYIGARLLEKGHRVAFIARGTSRERLASTGIELKSPLGNFVSGPLQAVESAESLHDRFDLVVIGTKTWQVAEATSTLRAVLTPQTMLLTVQNGVDAPREVEEQLTRIGISAQVVGGAIRIISFLRSPGVIEHLGVAPHLECGLINGASSAELSNLKTTFESIGIKVTIPQNIWSALWTKFLFMSSWSGVGAASRLPVGLLRSNPASRALLMRAMSEVETLAAKVGVDLPSTICAQTMSFIDSLPADGTASMQRDIAAGRPSELEAQTGAVVRIARQHSVLVPTHETLYGLLAPTEEVARTIR